MEINEVAINVRFSEVDSMRIAHNASYYIWFEDGRFDFSFRVLKFDIKSLNTKILLPVVKSGCKYLKHIRFGDKLIQKTYMYVGETSKISFYYKLYNTSNILCAIGKTEHVLLRESGEMMLRIPKDIKELFKKAANKYENCFFTVEEKNNFENRLSL